MKALLFFLFLTFSIFVYGIEEAHYYYKYCTLKKGANAELLRKATCTREFEGYFHNGKDIRFTFECRDLLDCREEPFTKDPNHPKKSEIRKFINVSWALSWDQHHIKNVYTYEVYLPPAPLPPPMRLRSSISEQKNSTNICDEHITQAQNCCEDPSVENCDVAKQVSHTSLKDKAVSVVGTAALPILNVVDKSSKALASHLLTCAKGVTRSAEVTYNLRAFKEACEKKITRCKEICLKEENEDYKNGLHKDINICEQEEAVALEEQADQGLTDTMKYTSCYNAVSEAAVRFSQKSDSPPSTDSTLDTSNLHSDAYEKLMEVERDARQKESLVAGSTLLNNELDSPSKESGSRGSGTQANSGESVGSGLVLLGGSSSSGGSQNPSHSSQSSSIRTSAQRFQRLNRFGLSGSSGYGQRLSEKRRPRRGSKNVKDVERFLASLKSEEERNKAKDFYRRHGLLRPYEDLFDTTHRILHEMLKRGELK